MSPPDLTTFAREVLLDKGAQHGVIAPLVAGLRFGGAAAELEEVAEEWGGAFGVAMQGLDDVMDLIGAVVVVVVV